MVAKGNKRKAVEVNATEADLIAEKCSELAKIVTGATNLPADVVAMLKDVLPFSLGQPKDKRHRFQEHTVLAVERILQGIEERYAKNIENSQQMLKEAKERAAPSEAAVSQAEQTLQTAGDRFCTETKVLAKATLDFRAAREAVEEAKKMQEDGDRDFKEAAKEKERLQSLITDLIEPLEKGDHTEVDAKCKSLMSALGKLDGFDEAMLMVLGSSLAKKPEVRGGFDIMAIDQLNKYMAKNIAPLDETLTAGEAGKQQRANAVKEAEEAAARALEAQKLKSEVFESAWNTKTGSETALKAAREGVKDLALQTKQCDRDLHSAEVERDVFAEYARKPFEELRERTTPPEPVAEVAISPTQPEQAVGLVDPEDTKVAMDVVLPEIVA